MERMNIQLILKRSPVFRNPIIFMILLDLIGIIIIIVETVHIKQNLTDSFKEGSSQKQTYRNYFKMSIALLVLLIIRMFLMITAECIRAKKYASRIEVKHNHQVFIFIGRYLYMVIVILPFLMYSYISKMLQELSFWIPIMIIIAQEMPGFIFVIYLSICKHREIQTYIKKQDQIAQQIRDQEFINTNRRQTLTTTQSEATLYAGSQQTSPELVIRRRSTIQQQQVASLENSINQQSVITTCQFLNSQSPTMIRNQLSSLQNDSSSPLTLNLNIRQQKSLRNIDNQQENSISQNDVNAFRDQSTMPQINLGRFSRKDSIIIQDSHQSNSIHSQQNNQKRQGITNRIGSSQNLNNHLLSNNLMPEQIYYEGAQVIATKDKNRKGSFQTNANTQSIPFQVPIVTNHNNQHNFYMNQDIDNNTQQEIDFFNMSRERRNSLPINRAIDRVNRLRLNLQSNQQLDSIVEEVNYNNQKLQIPKYGSVKVHRDMPGQKQQISPDNDYLMQQLRNNSIDEESYDFDMSSVNHSKINLINSGRNRANNNRKGSDFSTQYQSGPEQNYSNNNSITKTKQKSITSRGVRSNSIISESWSPNDQRVANLYGKI